MSIDSGGDTITGFDSKFSWADDTEPTLASKSTISYQVRAINDVHSVALTGLV